MPFAHPHAPMEELSDIVRKLKPTVLIGAAAIPNVFTPEIIKDMASFNKSPVIFALSNPTSKAECTAEQASIRLKMDFSHLELNHLDNDEAPC